jgi:hypothetical protein
MVKKAYLNNTERALYVKADKTSRTYSTYIGSADNYASSIVWLTVTVEDLCNGAVLAVNEEAIDLTIAYKSDKTLIDYSAMFTWSNANCNDDIDVEVALLSDIDGIPSTGSLGDATIKSEDK